MEKIWAFLMHLGTNNWSKKGRSSLSEKDEEDFIYREELFCDKEVWRKVTEFLPSCGINTLLIDVEDGMQYDRHPEISVKGAWSKAELKEELQRLRGLGLNPIPKCNFSCGHSAWLKDYAYMVGTATYDQVCKDIIEELIEVFDTPDYFHLGLEEEDMQSQNLQPVAIVRAPYKKLRDAQFLFDVCRAHGVRPWIWADQRDVEAFGGDEAFQAGIGRDVILSPWYYDFLRNRPDACEQYPIAKFIRDYSKLGYDLVPTGSTWSWHLNNKELMTATKRFADPKGIAGFMSASWMLTTPKKYYALLNDAFTFGNAKADVYGE